MKIILLSLLFYFAQLKTKRQIVIKYANKYLDSSNWAYGENGKDRLSANGKVFFCDSEPKCNLFVYEMLDLAGIEIELNNSMGGWCMIKHPFQPKERPPLVKDWYDENVEGMELVGQGSEGVWNSMPGDIIVDYREEEGLHHMGIISGTKKTISACEDSICETDYGWSSSTAKVFRYE